MQWPLRATLSGACGGESYEHERVRLGVLASGSRQWSGDGEANRNFYWIYKKAKNNVDFAIGSDRTSSHLGVYLRNVTLERRVDAPHTTRPRSHPGR